jgi:hypothetical protein
MMWKPWRNTFEPWRTLPGWEFDLLRALPTNVANQLYRSAWADARPQLMRTWQWWAFLGLVLVFAWVSVALVWVVATALGLGAFGRVCLELAYHATVGVLIFHPLSRVYMRHSLPYIRAALVNELVWFVRDELAPPRSARRQTRKG